MKLETITITIDNKNVTFESAMRDAAEAHDQTGTPVLVNNMVGDPVAYFVNGKVIKY